MIDFYRESWYHYTIPGIPVSMNIHIPNSAFLGNINAFFKGFNPSDPDSLQITAHKKWISVHPLSLSMLAALASTVKPENITYELFEAKSKHYLARMGLFSFFDLPRASEMIEHESAGRFVPLTQIRDSATLTTFIANIIPLLHLEPHQAEPIRYIVSELVRNVLEHALAPQGAFICAQFYQKTNKISIGIADTGAGIKKTINASHIAKTDLDALRLALMPGVTGTTKREGGTEQNAGAGLFFTKSIASVNRGFFVIYSGTAMYKLLKRPGTTKRITLHADPFKDHHSAGNDYPAWPGTAVGIDIVLDSTTAFSSLLDHIRDTYARAIRERKAARYKKPHFI